MRTRSKPQPAQTAFRIAFPRSRGVALISVLAVMILITALVVGFLFRAGRERSASASYVANSSAQLLADTAVNLVQAQINQATSSGLAWASQPGAIRVFDNTGNLQNVYRLYSAPTLSAAVTQANVGTVLANDLAPGTWAADPGLWTDLNAPIVVSGTTATDGTAIAAYSVYPILDPRDPADPGTVAAPKVSTVMPGFSITSAPGATTAQPAPMPVRWLYVLQNGEVLAPTGSGNAITVAGASAANPITGRIAFWTDDETAKVNINNAVGSLADWGSARILPGTWDTPRFQIRDEGQLFSRNQPVKGEYQRYPGHPATTDLHGIFNALHLPMDGYPYDAANPTATASDLFSLMPRYSDVNSSKGGSRNTTATQPPPVIGNGVAKADRLFSSLGELLFNPQRNSNGISRQQLESGKFFLTAQSRAPEVTLFGTPRIAMWPIHKDKGVSTRTPLDNLVVRASSIGDGTKSMPYYIQRSSSTSNTADYTNIPRNQQLFSYLKDLSSRPIPGFGGSFRGKYSYSRPSSGSIPASNETDQILTEMVDYIRCVNLFDRSATGTFTRFTDNPTGVTGYNFKSLVLPLEVEDGGVTTSGLGRALTVSEIGVHIICTAEGSTTAHINNNSPAAPAVTGYLAPDIVGGKPVSPARGSANDPRYASNLPVDQYLRDNSGNIVGLDLTNPDVITFRKPLIGNTTAPDANASPFPANPTLTTTGVYGGPLQALQPGEKKLQAMLLFEIASPMMGYHGIEFSGSPAFKLKVSGIQGIVVDAGQASSTPFPASRNGTLDNFPSRSSEQATLGLIGFRYPLRGRFNAWSGQQGTLLTTEDWQHNWIKQGNASRPYNYISNPFTATASTLRLAGGFTLEMQVPQAGNSSETYQLIDVEFPAVANIPLPDLAMSGMLAPSTVGERPPNVAADWWGFDFRIRQVGGLTLDTKNKNGDDSNLNNRPMAARGTVIRAAAPVPGSWSYDHVARVLVPTLSNQTQAATFGGSDVVRTLVAKDGDYRLVAAQTKIKADGSTSSPFDKGPGYDAGVKMGNLFKDQNSARNTAGVDDQGKLVPGANYGQHITPKVPSGMAAAKRAWDWDSGLPEEPDGAYANKPDEGNIYISGQNPYYNREQQGNPNILASYFTANRIVNSPVMFGSLPTGVVEGISWRTLLFRPQASRSQDPTDSSVSGGPADHLPKDHLFLDLFNMPVVEPYAISEPFSTSGKINMNYQIVPFTYLERSTGLRAVLSSELVTRVPKAAAAQRSTWDFQNVIYKGGFPSASASAGGVTLARLPVNLDSTEGTLRQFKNKFDNWEIFKSATEICDLYLVPQGYTLTDFSGTGPKSWYGDEFALVGDNVRERPYGNIYPRLTTKSNTFKVYYKVQVLKNQSPTPSTWDESKGVVTGEFVGSTTIERYLDPNNKSIPDYATDPTASSLDNYYQWRTVANDGFPP